MRAIKLLTCACLVIAGFAVYSPAQDGKPQCKQLNGKIVLTVIPAQNEPYGRLVGTIKGTLKGSTTTAIRSLNATPSNVLLTTEDNIFVLEPQEILLGEAEGEYTPIPEEPSEVAVAQTVTFTGGTGNFEDATGSMEVKGIGYDLGGGPGLTYFEMDYDGEVCGSNLN
jgi:hypothetical protein